MVVPHTMCNAHIQEVSAIPAQKSLRLTIPGNIIDGLVQLYAARLNTSDPATIVNAALQQILINDSQRPCTQQDKSQK